MEYIYLGIGIFTRYTFYVTFLCLLGVSRLTRFSYDKHVNFLSLNYDSSHSFHF